MKRVIDCDDVFEVLTRGPFSGARRQDVAVERHLQACHECRQLAEALRPAVDLLHESMGSQEGEALPAYLGRLPAADATADRPPGVHVPGLWKDAASPRGGPEYGQSGGSRGRQGVMQFALATMLGVCLCVLWSGGFEPDRAPGSLNGSVTADASFAAPALRSLQMLLDLKLPAACFQSSAGNVSHTEAKVGSQRSAASSAALHCCSGCHAAAGRAGDELTRPVKLHTQQLAMVSRSCAACHDI